MEIIEKTILDNVGQTGGSANTILKKKFVPEAEDDNSSSEE
jgi:hypothetical protein